MGTTPSRANHTGGDKMSSGVSRVMTGSVEGTGANLDVRTVGFRPRAVKLVNADSDDSLEWQDTLPDDYGYKSVKAGANAVITSLGITPLSDGFRIGADTDINVAGEVVHWIAFE
jgi:hypothetical protein